MKHNKTAWTFYDKELEQLRRASINRGTALAKHYNGTLMAVKTVVKQWFPDLPEAQEIIGLPSVPMPSKDTKLDAALRAEQALRYGIKCLYDIMEHTARSASDLVRATSQQYEVMWDIPADYMRIRLKLVQIN